MTPEERERAERIDRILEFLASNQAELSARQSESLSRLEKIVESHTQQIESNTRQIESNTQQIAELGRYLLNLAHIVERTDERLNSVITMVERRFGNGQN